MFDPTDAQFLSNPYPALNDLRETGPVHYDERYNRWFVTRHADVRACLRDKRLGRNYRHVGTDEEFGAEPLDSRWTAFWDVERWSLLWIEPPEHTRIRKLVAAAFTPRSVEALREPARQLAHRLIAPLVERGELRLLRDYAQPFSISLICQMLGVPSGREQDLLDWSHAMVKMYELNVTEAQALAANAASARFRDYVVELIDERRSRPHDDMLTRLANARVDGEQLSDAEIVSTIVVLLNAGHEATVNTLGNGVLALLRHPEQWDALKAGRATAANAVEEFIRWDPPLQLFERWVLAEGVEVGGVPIERGQKVAMLFGAANRDPRVFENAERFDVSRANAGEHIGFGGGIHACIGAPLARIELEASLRAMLDSVARIDLAAEPLRNGTFVIWGLDELELRVTPSLEGT